MPRRQEVASFPLQLRTVLAGLLRKHGLRASELARRSGVPKQVLSLWLAGVEPRKLSHLKSVAWVFGLTIDALCYGDPPTAPGEPAAAQEGLYEITLRRRE